MDKFEDRRARLKALVASLGHGGIKTVAAGIEVADSYVSRMLAEPGKAGRKRITEATADKLDKAFPQWMTAPTDPSPEPSEGKTTPNANRKSAALSSAITTIAKALEKADPSTRELAAGMLSNLARNPENHARVSLGLLAILGNGGPQFETTQATEPHSHP